tara:strand:- start:363 stop:857 length:495 start_codon:yes stop_codon:yes gene_type:complete
MPNLTALAAAAAGAIVHDAAVGEVPATAADNLPDARFDEKGQSLSPAAPLLLLPLLLALAYGARLAHDKAHENADGNPHRHRRRGFWLPANLRRRFSSWWWRRLLEEHAETAQAGTAAEGTVVLMAPAPDATSTRSAEAAEAAEAEPSAAPLEAEAAPSAAPPQ